MPTPLALGSAITDSCFLYFVFRERLNWLSFTSMGCYVRTVGGPSKLTCKGEIVFLIICLVSNVSQFTERNRVKGLKSDHNLHFALCSVVFLNKCFVLCLSVLWFEI